MLRLLRLHPAFRRLFLASTTSLIGDWLSFVAVSLLVQANGGGALALALVLAVHALPHALLAPLAGTLADRFDRRRLLLAGSVTQAALTLLMAAAALRGHVALVQILVLCRSAAAAFVIPAETAALRRVVPEADLLAANTALSNTWSVTFVVGMALGGVIAMLGPAPAILLDAGSFLGAAALLRGLPAMRPEGKSSSQTPRIGAVIAAVPGDMLAALRHARARPDLFRAVFAKAPIAIAGGGGWVALNLVAGRLGPLGSAAISLGVLQAVRGAGTGLGPLAAAAWIRRGGSAKLAAHAAALITFGAIAIFPLSTSAPLLVVIALLWGMGSGSNWVLSSEGIQRLAPDRFMGRLAGVDELAMTAGQVAGALAGAALAERTGSLATAAWVGVGFGAAGWWMLMHGRETADEVEGQGSMLDSAAGRG